MGEQHFRTQKNSLEIISRELHCGGPCDPIRVDIFEIRDEGYGTGIHGDGISSTVNLLPHILFEN